MKKITIVTFSGVSNKGGSDAHYKAWRIASFLEKNNHLDKVIALTYDLGCGISKDFFVVPPSRFLVKLIFKLIDYLGKYFEFNSRRLKEECFDFFSSHSDAIKHADAVLFLKPCFPNTVKRGKIAGAVTFGQATILHPIFNYRVVKAEYDKYGLNHRKSNYTDKRRIKNITSFFDELDYIFLPSKKVSKFFTDEGVDQSKLLVTPTINGGIPGSQFKPKQSYLQNDELVFLHISHMSMIKGIGRLFEVWKDLNLKNTKLILVGHRNENVDILYHTIRPQNTIFAGPTKKPEYFYHKADVMVQPSLSDASPFTVLEAMACGLPVIASDACGTSDLITNYQNGIIFDSQNCNEFALALRWFDSNRDKIQSMGIKSRKIIEEYSVDSFNNALMDGLLFGMNSKK